MPLSAYQTVVKNYQDNFSLLRLRMMTTPEYQADMPYFDKIIQTATYSHSRYFSCIPTKKPTFHYCFTATLRQISEHRALTPFLAGHEFFHALSHEKFLAGERNTTYYSKASSKMIGINSKNIGLHANEICSYADTILKSPDPDNEHALLGKMNQHIALKDLWVEHNKLSIMLHNMNGQAEEFACDNFALKMFPETDLDLFEAFLGEDFEINPDEVERHPSSKERISCLRQQQMNILK